MFDNWQIKDQSPSRKQETFDKYFAPCVYRKLVGDINQSDVCAKVHTIREDKSNRWIQTRLIHLVINNRTPERFQFAPLIICTAIQKISIVWDGPIPGVYVDDELLLSNDVERLALNDGFDTVGDFYNYFNTDFTGKIIHWDDVRY